MNNEVVKRIETEIEKLKNKDFNILFYVPDAKCNSNGYVSYIYQMASSLKNLGYNVKMIYNLDNEYSDEELYEIERRGDVADESRIFEGIKDSLGEACSKIEHVNISKTELNVSPSDFLIIPEVFAQVMNQTKKLACKRIALVQNFDYLSDFIPLGTSWANFGITDAIVTTDRLSNMVKSVFPYVNTKTLNPYIPSYFYDDGKQKKLVVNIICKDQKYVNRIIKPFYWKYPILKWVSFRDLRGFPREMFADILREGAITVFVDDDTNFGYSALESIRSGNIVIGKIPNYIPEWMGDNNGLFDNGIWFNNIDDIYKILADVIVSWMKDDIPSELLEAMKETNKKYQYKDFEKSLEETIGHYIQEREKEFNEVLIIAKNEK